MVAVRSCLYPFIPVRSCSGKIWSQGWKLWVDYVRILPLIWGRMWKWPYGSSSHIWDGLLWESFCVGTTFFPHMVFNLGNSSRTASTQATKKWKITCLAYFKRMHKRSRKDLCACPLTSPPKLPTAGSYSASSPRLLLPPINCPATAPNVSFYFSLFIFLNITVQLSGILRCPQPDHWPGRVQTRGGR